MENEILEKIKEQDIKLEAIHRSVERTRKYFLWTLIVTVATVVLPLVGILLVVPWLMNTLMSDYSIQ
jgi:hypothetical protein